MNITGVSSIICISGRPVGTKERKINEIREMLKSEEIIAGTKKEVEKIFDILGDDYIYDNHVKLQYINS